MLPYGKQDIDEDDIKAVTDALRGDFLTTGPKIAEFEEALCAVTEARYAVACSNGTTALHLAALALGLGADDIVIVPSVTFLATANAVRYCGAEIVFSDVNSETGLMEVEHLEDALSRCKNKKIKAVFPVHLTGQCVDINTLSTTAKNRGLSVVLDACHALGGTYKNKSVGAAEHEDMSTFSFHPVKTIAMGEGGAITTNDEKHAAHMKNLRNHAMVKTRPEEPWYYEMSELGYNYRITDIQCALGLSQLKKLDRFVARRRALVALYDKLLAPLSPILKTPHKIPDCHPAWHLYSIRIDFKKLGIDRATIMMMLQKRGIGTQVHYIPVHQQPYYKERYGDITLPGADEYYERTLSLPLFPAMTEENVHQVVHALSDILGN